MGARGGYWSIAPEHMARLLAAHEGEDRDAAVLAVLDSVSDEQGGNFYFDTDKAWDNLHRAYNLDDTPNGQLYEDGEPPFHLLTFGGRRLYHGTEYHLYLISPDDTALLASALHEVDEGWLRKRWFSLGLDRGDYPIDEGEFHYLTCNTRRLPAFFARAAANGRALLFYVSL